MDSNFSVQEELFIWMQYVKITIVQGFQTCKCLQKFKRYMYSTFLPKKQNDRTPMTVPQ